MQKHGKQRIHWTLVVLIVLCCQACAVFKPAPTDHGGKVLKWSGMTWYVKEASHRQGPGNNWFSAGPESVWVDEDGCLHLAIRKSGKKWLCAEIISTDFISYGKYILEVNSRLDDLDPNAVFGFFTWRPKGGTHNNEMDIEFSRWGRDNGPNAQYVVQPYTNPDHVHNFYFKQLHNCSMHEFIWLPHSISFYSDQECKASSPKMNRQAYWNPAGVKVPRARKTQLRLNLWLNSQDGLKEGDCLELIIKQITHMPVSDMASIPESE